MATESVQLQQRVEVEEEEEEYGAKILVFLWPASKTLNLAQASGSDISRCD